MSLPPFAQVAVALPLPGPFTYAIPEALQGALEVGHGVLVPFGPRQISGFVVGFSEAAPEGVKRVRAIQELLALEPLFSVDQLPFFEWAGRYYHRPLGEVLATALPSGVQRKSRRVVRLSEAGALALQEAGEGAEGDVGETLGGDAGGLFGGDAGGDADPVKDEGAEVEARILARVGAARQGVALQTLIKEDATAAKVLRALERRGLIEVAQDVSQARAAARTVTRYALVGALAGQGEGGGTEESRRALGLQAFTRPGPIQEAVVDALIRRGEASGSELRAEVSARGLNPGRVRAILRQLEEGGALILQEDEAFSTGPAGMRFAAQSLTLRPDQAAAVATLEASIAAGRFEAFLLQGVTGSGKTEVYIRAVAATLKAGRQAIVLVPEIGLTPQLLGRFEAHFGEAIASLHSSMTDQERFDAWRRIRRGEVRLAIGARSAIFAPFEDLGLIVVDEEHDGSFKQDDGLTYSARDLAVVRARQLGGVAILGSATPSLETRYNAERGAFTHLHLRERATARPLPEVRLVDMRIAENRPEEGAPDLSPTLIDALRETFARGEQAILLLNRRGFAPFVLCPRCGGSFHCPQCDVSLTYHRRRNFLLCHHCGLTEAKPDNCPQCGYHALELTGQGTERLEGDLDGLFPGVAIARLDRDTARGRDAFLKVLDAFRQGETQLLVGTQMVAKGHDFPGVTCVGILQADYLLNLPDFRASERTFQLVTQVAGRAGRGEAPGTVFVQSHTPEHYSLALAAEHDFEGFYAQEVRLREIHRYPPFARLILLHISSTDEREAQGVAAAVARALRQLKGGLGVEGIDVRGPAPSPLGRLMGRYRLQILVTAPKASALQRVLAAAIALPEIANPPRDARVSWDVDPVHLL